MACKQPSVVSIIPKDADTKRERIVPELTSSTIKFKLRDPVTGNYVTLSMISDATMRLFNDEDQKVIQIGSSDDTDVKTFFDAEGQFKYVLAGEYNQMQSDDVYTQYEVHWARFTIAFTSGSDTHDYVFNYQIKIENNRFQSSS